MILAQKVLHPLDCGQVEVVGWFVKHQQIRVRNERAHHLGAHLPPSAELRKWEFKLIRMEAEAAERLLYARFYIVAAKVLELRLQIAELRKGLVAFLRIHGQVR